MKYFVILFSIIMLIACDNSSNRSSTKNSNVELTPLSPYHTAFDCDYGKCSINYFFAARGDWKNPDYQSNLKNIITQAEKNIPKKVGLYSLSVYEKTDKLNKDFQGSYTKLEREHHRDIISFTRWNEGKMDMFYLVEDGDIVYDLLENREINPPRGISN